MTKKKKIILSVVISFLVILLSGGGYIYYSYGKIKETVQTIPECEKISSNEKATDNKEVEEKVDYKEVQGITNILLIGVDERSNGEVSRSDTMMILTIDDNHKKIKLTSLMRDAYVDIPGHSSQKINHSFAYGGTNLLMKTIEQNFNIKLDKYVRINFQGFKDLAEAVDGLDVTINNTEELNELNRCILLEISEDPKSELKKVKKIVDRANLLALREEGAPLISKNPKLTRNDYNYIFKEAGLVANKGKAHLTGMQLLAYSRMRHIDDGVYGRTERQKNVINLILNKLKDTPQVKYPFIANKLLPYVKTNIPFTESINLAFTTCKINNFNIEHLQIPTVKLSSGRKYGVKGWVLLMDKENNIKAMHDFIFNDKKYEEKNYSAFNYGNSEYYSKVEVKSSNNSKLDNYDDNYKNNEYKEDNYNSNNENSSNDKTYNEQDDSNNITKEKESEKIECEENEAAQENLKSSNEVETNVSDEGVNKESTEENIIE